MFRFRANLFFACVCVCVLSTPDLRPYLSLFFKHSKKASQQTMELKKKTQQKKIRRDGHLLDLVSVKESGLQLDIQFRHFSLSFQADVDTKVIQIVRGMYKNYQLVNPGFPNDLKCQWLNSC